MEVGDSYFSHEADMGIIGRGPTLEQAFVEAARATFAIMADLSTIEAKQSIDISFQEDNPEFALITWLNLLIAQARSQNLALVEFQLEHKNACWEGKAWGEPWRKEMTRGTEVKGATLTMLSIKKVAGMWEARCVVDV